MDESESLQERDRWTADHISAIHSRRLPWEDKPWKVGAEEPLSIASVFAALMEIRKGKSRELKPYLRQPSPDRFFDPANWEDVDRPPEAAVKIITRALQAGAKGEQLIKKALELKPRAKGGILARHIAGKLTKPKDGWPKNEEERKRFNWDTVEWVKPSKGEVERALESRYPKIYDSLPKKDGNGGKLLRSDFWDDAGLKNEIDQARGYR